MSWLTQNGFDLCAQYYPRCLEGENIKFSIYHMQEDQSQERFFDLIIPTLKLITGGR